MIYIWNSEPIEPTPIILGSSYSNYSSDFVDSSIAIYNFSHYARTNWLDILKRTVYFVLILSVQTSIFLRTLIFI